MITIASLLHEVLNEHDRPVRDVVDIPERDGTQVTQEVYLFADIDAQGRFSRSEERP